MVPAGRVTPGRVLASQITTPGDHWQADRSPGVTMPGGPRARRLGRDTRADPGDDESGATIATRRARPPDPARHRGPPTFAASPRPACRPSLPGLGQLFNRRRQLAALFLIPSLVVLLVAFLLRARSSRRPGWRPGSSRRRSSARCWRSTCVVLAWRLTAVGQAFLDTRRSGTDRAGSASSASWSIASLVALPHLVVYRYGTVLGDTSTRVFAGEVLGSVDDRDAAGPAPPRPGERINVLLVGDRQDAARSATLTDTMMVASLDPVGHTVSMVSVPRDLVDVPLGNGDIFGPKLNSLCAYAERHPKDFPKGGMRRSRTRSGALLGSRSTTTRSSTSAASSRWSMRSAASTSTSQRGSTTRVRRLRAGGVKPGSRSRRAHHHLDGAEALAYARSRKAPARATSPGRPTAADPRRAPVRGDDAAGACSSSSPSCSTRSARRSGPTSPSSACPSSPRSSTRSARRT